MALVVNDRVKETSTTTGTGTFDLAGAVSGFESFVTGIGNSNTTYYAIVNENGEFEVGLRTVTDAATDTLSRDTIISSSNSDSAVNFGAGTKNVFCTLPASKAVILDSSGNIVANNGSNLTNLNAEQLTSGTVPDARFPATLPAADGSALTALNASNVASGTLSSDRLPTVPTTKGGTGLTAIGTANQVLAVNSGATALEYQTISADITGVTAGDGLTGGGTTGDVTLNVGAGSGISVTADQVAHADTSSLSGTYGQTGNSDGTVTANINLTVDGFGHVTDVQSDNVDLDSRYIQGVTAGTLLDGGGTTGTVTLNVDLSELTTSTSDGDGDFFAVVDAANAQKKLTKGNINISGFNNDSGFIDGSALNASNLSSGTVPDARFPATLPALNGSALTALNATQLTSGTVPDARFPATLPALNGSALTNLNATALASGTVANARLDAQLQDVAGLAVTDGNFIVGNGSNFVAESGATARTSLGLGSIATLNTVTLTTNTTGNYVASLTAGALIDVGAAGEGATPSIAVDLSEATDMTEAMVGTDEFIVLDASSQKRKAANEINLSIFNNDLPGDISGVTAGNGLTGGGTTGTVTLNVGAGTGIDVSADAIAVDVSDFMSNGVNNRLLTATGADAMNAEANLTFDGSTLTVTGTAAATTFSGSGASLTNIPNGALDNSAITINGTSTALGGSINVGDITGVTAGTLLDGGGTTGTVTLNVDLSELTTSTTNGDGDFFVVVDASNAQRKLTKANINNSGFNNDAGYTTNVGDITGVTAGSGLTGGGASGSVTINMDTGGIGSGTYGSTANATKIDTFTVDAYGRVTAVATGATGDIDGVTAGTLLDGGGTSGTVTLNVDLSELSTSTTNGDGDYFVVVDTANAQRKLTKANIAISGFNNDSGFTTNTGTVTSVSGGNGLTGTVTTSGSLAVGAGTGIDVAADAISVDVSDFMTNGVNNRVLTATGTDAMNAEANLTFDGSTFNVTGSGYFSGNIGRDTTDYISFSNNAYMNIHINASNEFRFEADGDFHADGDVIAFSTTVSDERLKTDIEKIENAIDKVAQLNGYTFTYKQDGKKSAGVIAQEVEKVLPSAVSEKELPLKINDGVAYKTVQYDQLVGLLIEAVNELQEKVSKLEGK